MKRPKDLGTVVTSWCWKCDTTTTKRDLKSEVE
jgi:hypothetical protein